ncbi:hypothetical protein CBR_g5716 [Chara braunii]|uniref:Right handed beta helix domain-containing protein n=1 Tax=Chara braunii TaxID=69332 RepID=A0A388KJ52_CHABU|nr:hypothetical protein CBR_g5716 [Chara braunii]|eukprot:GBG70084.1 hypothetical protein CBR_g5716 [Chara braunii]
MAVTRRAASVSTRGMLVTLLVVTVAAPLMTGTNGYGLTDFLAAYTDPRVNYHAVRGNVALRASFPPLNRSLTLVGRGPGGARPVLDGRSRYGGIVLEADKNLTLVNLEMRNFRSVQGGGAAVRARSSEKIVLDRCVFRNNRAAGNGGAVNLVGVDESITRCVFEMNRSGGDGGGLWSEDDGFASIRSCVFKKNQAASRGGGAAFRRRFTTDINGCSFDGNKASGMGGGAIWFSRTGARLYDTRFSSNVGGQRGGAVRFDGSEQGTVRFCRGNTYSGNSAKNASSDNIYVSIPNVDDGISCTFCPSIPARTVIDDNNNVNVTCRFC